MNTKKLLLIAAIAVMLTAATSAYGYYETWNGWWSSGTIYYNENEYTRSDEGGVFYDSTYSETLDKVYLSPHAQPMIPFFSDDDTIFLVLSTSGTYGWKETDTEDTKEGSGVWDADGYHRNQYGQLVKIFDIWGTWESVGDHFDYTDCPCPPGGPPTYEVDLISTGSIPSGIDATGDSEGERTYYSTREPGH